MKAARISGKQEYLDMAQKADGFIQRELYEDGCLYVSVREGKKGAKDTAANRISGEGCRSVSLRTCYVSGRFVRLGKAGATDYGGVPDCERCGGNKTVFQIHSVGQHGANRTGTDGRISAQG